MPSPGMVAMRYVFMVSVSTSIELNVETTLPNLERRNRC
jgi:hypothetical protein